MSFDHSQASKLVGSESGPIAAVDKICKSDVRHWCELLGDPDPNYNDAIKTGEKPAPPPMLMAWSMPPLWPPKAEATEPHEKLFELLDAAGYAGTITIGMEQEFLQPARIGDRLSFKVKVESVSKKAEETKHGTGYLVKLLYTILDGAGKVVSRQKCTVLKFRTLAAGS